MFTVEYREATGKGENRRLKKPKEGLPKNPGVIYSTKEQTNIAMESDKAWRFIKNELLKSNKMFDLEIQGKDRSTKKKVILQAYQLHPVKGNLVHVDFREVDANTMVIVDVPLQTSGVSQAVKMGGVLQIISHTIKVKAPAGSIPSDITVDVTELDFGKSLHVKDLVFPKKVEPVLPNNNNYAVITVSAAIQEEVEAKVETAETPAAGAAAPDAQAKQPQQPAAKK